MKTGNTTERKLPISFIDLKRQHAEIESEISASFERVLRSGRYILGEAVEQFEKEWAAFCGVPAAAAVATGTDALTLALIASGAVRKNQGDEVITSAMSSAYTALSILNAGGVPVFVDVMPDTYTLSPEAVDRAITPRTRAVVPVHLYGRSADMEAISSIAIRRNLVVVEDAAQAHIRPVANVRGRTAAFSFYPTKNLGAYGDGGAVVSDDEALIDRIRSLRQGGHLPALLGVQEGRNSRMDEIQAALLSAKLPLLDQLNRRRREIADSYTKGLGESKGTICPSSASPMSNANHLYVIQHPHRDRLKDYLAHCGIETMIHYPYLLHQQPLFRRGEQRAMPVAEQMVKRILSLPLYPQLQNQEVQDVIAAIVSYEIDS